MKSVKIIALCLVVMAGFSYTHAITEAQCEAAAAKLDVKKTDDFRACVKAGTPGKPISLTCCVKLASFAQYIDCFDMDKFKARANTFLAPETNIDAVKQACLARR